jgi:hypothetical protein
MSGGIVQTHGPVSRVLIPPLKRQHPNLDELDWGDCERAGQSADGAFFFVFMVVCALTVVPQGMRFLYGNFV